MDNSSFLRRQESSFINGEIADKISFLNFSAMTVVSSVRFSALDAESVFVIGKSRVTLC